ncbi:iron-sulfur cluster assembly scaffold protein [Candidatus Phytoplasma solani]|uniref:iron-sulfur cluster assembly scaffold protein n=1 Tax=Candidatus Phytoplasma solani TaxID=69896 RepID=UPI0032DABB8E
MLNNNKHQLILKHCQNPQNQTEKPLKGYQTFKKEISCCGDQVIIQLKLDPKKTILDLKYEANACSICVASASLMSVNMKNLDKKSSLNKINHFIAMINKESYDQHQLNSDLQVLDIVHQLPHKTNCVLLPWKTLQAFWLN